jgi:ABC-type phosphate transport system auxiliary subunit
MNYRLRADIDGGKMSTAMETIVGAYVRMRNHHALEGLRMHRHRLAIDVRLRKNSNYDYGLIIRKMAEDIKAIEEGLEQLDASAMPTDLIQSSSSVRRRSA